MACILRRLSPLVLGVLLLSACKRGELSRAWLEVCSGFAITGSSQGLLVARAHVGDPPAAPQPGEGSLKRIDQTLESLDANPLSDAPLNIVIGNRTWSGVRSNARGYIDLEDLTGFPPPLVRVQIQLEDPRYQAAPIAAEIPVYDGKPGLAIISDIDDTLLDSGVVDKAKMAKNALVRSTWELQAFPAAAETLSRVGAGLPLFYISGSPWGFRKRIEDYFQRSGFPAGTFLLKRFSSEPLTDQMAYKWQHISRVLSALPQKRWILFGDSGESDPEIYRRFLNEYPDRVEAIYMHMVTPEPVSSPRFAGMRTFVHWSELASLATAPPATAPPATGAAPH